MKVICKKYDTCTDRHSCYHSKPHYITSGWSGINSLYNCNSNLGENCICSEIYLRRYKLEKLEQYEKR